MDIRFPALPAITNISQGVTFMAGAGSAAVGAGKGFDSVVDRFARHNLKRREKLASKLGVKLEELPKRRFQKLAGNTSKLAAKVAVIGSASLAGGMAALGSFGRFLK